MLIPTALHTNEKMIERVKVVSERDEETIQNGRPSSEMKLAETGRMQ
jgi:hypothetical protein